MLNVTQIKNTLLDGGTIASDLFATPKECEDFFESIEKPAEVVAVPRPTFIRTGILTTLRGSAYMEYGNTKVMALIAPPHELLRTSGRRVNMGVLTCFVNFAAFATGELETVPEREKHLGTNLTKALQPLVCRTEFLNFQLDIRVLILEDDGCLLSTAINCCGVALAECGISTYDIISSATACVFRGYVFINPTAKVEELLWQHRGGNALLGTAAGSTTMPQEHGMIVTAGMDTFDQLTLCQQFGYLLHENYVRLMDHTLEITKEMRKLISHVLTTRVKEQHSLDLREQAENMLEDKRLAAVIERLKQQGLTEFLQSNIKEDIYTKKM